VHQKLLRDRFSMSSFVQLYQSELPFHSIIFLSLLLLLVVLVTCVHTHPCQDPEATLDVSFVLRGIPSFGTFHIFFFLPPNPLSILCLYVQPDQVLLPYVVVCSSHDPVVIFAVICNLITYDCYRKHPKRTSFPSLSTQL
jgi:hypothetical protein